MYLLDALPRANLGSAKLPKTGPVMLHFFHNLIKNPKMLQNSNKLTLASKVAVEEAARETVVEVRRVWKHHFGLRVIEGREYEGGEVDQQSTMVTKDQLIVAKIVKLFTEWKYCEQVPHLTSPHLTSPR